MNLHQIWSLLESTGAEPTLKYLPDQRVWHFEPGLEKSNGAIRESLYGHGDNIERIVKETWDELTAWFKKGTDGLPKSCQHLVVENGNRVVWNGATFEKWRTPNLTP